MEEGVGVDPNICAKSKASHRTVERSSPPGRPRVTGLDALESPIQCLLTDI